MGKRKIERKKRKKRLMKQIEGLNLQKTKHLLKVETEEGSKDTTPEYWKGEIEEFEYQKNKKENKLKNIKENK